MKTVCKKLLSLMLVAMLLVSAVPFQAFAAEGDSVETSEPAAQVTETGATEMDIEEVVTEPVAQAAADTEDESVQESQDVIVEDPTEVEETTSNSTAAASTSTGKTYTIYLWVDSVATGIYMPPYDSGKPYTVTKGDTYGNLPELSQSHYTFGGWYYVKDGKQVFVDSDTVVKGGYDLYAKFTKKEYTVTFQRYPAGGTSSSDWVDVKTITVDALDTVSLPSKNDYKLDGYTITGWEIKGSNSEFTSSTKITKDVIVRPIYECDDVTLRVYNPEDGTSSSYKTGFTVQIGERIGTLPDPGARDGYAFVRWEAENGKTIATKENLSDKSEHPAYYPAMGTTFYAIYEPSITVYLYIHTNGNTQTATKIVPYYEVTAQGSFDTKTINMYSIFSSYGNYDDNGDAAYGWYDALQWEKYCSGKAANSASVYTYSLNEETGKQLHPEYCELHIMLIDNGSNSSSNTYNTNTSTADSSNPTTGDYIMMAVAVMAVSAAALALIFYMKKRKASK